MSPGQRLPPAPAASTAAGNFLTRHKSSAKFVRCKAIFYPSRYRTTTFASAIQFL